MEKHSLLSNEQSAQLAGVSVDTIEKYCQIGLLTPEMKDNRPFFREADIKSLFYTKSNYSSYAAGSVVDTDVKGDLQATTESNEKTEQTPQSTSIGADPSVAQATGVDSIAGVESNDETPAAESIAEASTKAPGDENQAKAATEFTQRESQLLEMNQTLREQIELLREERDWLRQRIEHLETRGEREQMLLLAESETVRRLIKTETLTEKLMNFRLPWFSNSDK